MHGAQRNVTYDLDFLLGLASLELLYSGSNHICLLDHSLSKPQTTPQNPSHSPVASLKAPSWVHSSSFLYTTPLRHLTESSSDDHHLYAKIPNSSYHSPRPLFYLNSPPTLCCKPNLSMGVIQPTLPQPFQNRIYNNRPTSPNQENSRLFHTIVE